MLLRMRVTPAPNQPSSAVLLPRQVALVARGAAGAVGLALSAMAWGADAAKSLNFAAPAPTPASAPSTFPIVPSSTGLEFIDTSFENASPIWYEQATDGTILVHLLYD